MTSITIPSSLIAPKADKPLTPAMVSTLWEISAALDEARTQATTDEAIWLTIPSKRLRGSRGRDDNVWLRECLDRLMGLKLRGEYRGSPWGAVMIAEWQIIRGGTSTKVLIPPGAVKALRAPSTFAKIETTAAHSLSGHARRLYAILADKKRLGRPTWTFELDELRSLLDVADKPTYGRWQDFTRRVLTPAIKAINDYGTVEVQMTRVKEGRAVQSVRFDWRWKTIDEARETDEENARHSVARHQETPSDPPAPPLIVPPNLERRAEVAQGMKALARQLGSKAAQ